MKLTPEQIKISNIIHQNIKLMRDLKMQNETLMSMLPDEPASKKPLRLYEPKTGRMEPLGRGRTGGRT